MVKFILIFSMMIFSPVQAADINLIIKIIECESSGRHDAVGDDGKSYGIAQFQEITFAEMKIKAHLPKLQWKNPIDQLILMNWMIDHGYEDRWTCVRKLKKLPPIESTHQHRINRNLKGLKWHSQPEQ